MSDSIIDVWVLCICCGNQELVNRMADLHIAQEPFESIYSSFEIHYGYQMKWCVQYCRWMKSTSQVPRNAYWFDRFLEWMLIARWDMMIWKPMNNDVEVIEYADRSVNAKSTSISWLMRVILMLCFPFCLQIVESISILFHFLFKSIHFFYWNIVWFFLFSKQLFTSKSTLIVTFLLQNTLQRT